MQEETKEIIEGVPEVCTTGELVSTGLSDQLNTDLSKEVLDILPSKEVEGEEGASIRD